MKIKAFNLLFFLLSIKKLLIELLILFLLKIVNVIINHLLYFLHVKSKYY